MYICNDMWFPETTRILSLLGSDVVLNSPNWIGSRLDEETGRIVQAICVANAHQNSLFIASANRVGVERGQLFIGNSMIVHPTGKIIGDSRALTKKR